MAGLRFLVLLDSLPEFPYLKAAPYFDGFAADPDVWYEMTQSNGVLNCTARYKINVQAVDASTGTFAEGSRPAMASNLASVITSRIYD